MTHVIDISKEIHYTGTGVVSAFNGIEIVRITQPMVATVLTPGRQFISVPIGFKSDFGTIPKWAQGFVKAEGAGDRAYVLHDYLCDSQIYSRRMTDRILLSALKYCGVPFWERIAVYFSIRFYVIFLQEFDHTNEFGD